MAGVLLVLLSSFLTPVLSFGTDPEFGRSACLDLYPSGHEGEPQSTTSPYTLTVSGTSYNPGDMLTVTLSSPDQSVPFRGFILQARSVPDPEVKVGDFVPTDTAKVNCIVEGFGGKTVTHIDPSEKITEQITWIAPAQYTGDIQFRATVVKSFDVFWMNITSDVISGPKNTKRLQDKVTTDKTGTTPRINTDTEIPRKDKIQSSLQTVDLSTCGMTTGCYRYPDQCTHTCQYVLTWTRNLSDVVRFELQAAVTDEERYVTMALSRDLFMGEDSVTDCIYDEGGPSVIIQQSYNDGTDNAVLINPLAGLVPGSLSGFYGNGLLVCRFTRYVQPSTDGADSGRIFNLDEDYHILMAKGPVNEGAKGYHGNSKIASDVKVNVVSGRLRSIGGSSGYPLIKAHAILMILAWMVCASVAVLMPRYCKKTWVGYKCDGKDIWFQLHQSLGLCSLFLTVAGFVLVFINAGGYAKYQELPSKAHPPLGITTTILVIINPIMAAFRPAPTSGNRAIFNVFHFLVGLAAHIMSVVTIYIGIYMSKANMPVWSVKIMGAYVVWHIITEITLTVNKHCLSKTDNTTQSYVMTKTGEKESSKTSPSRHRVNRINTVVPIIHLIGVVTLSLALIIPIATT